jgi:L-ascorbate metabolism protein UlaG (beta-lactamase superfamily)
MLRGTFFVIYLLLAQIHKCTVDALIPQRKPNSKSSIFAVDRPQLFSSHVHHKQNIQQTTAATNNAVIVLTYLEINGWLLTMNNGVTVLIDPILEGALDFGVPQLFKGEKRVLPSSGLTEQLPLESIDCLLLSQGLEDHAHVQSLTKWRQVCEQKHKQLPIVAPPSAKGALQESGWYGSSSNIRILDHGETTQVTSKSDEMTAWNPLTIQATTGALVGPPWQKRENGYILSSKSMSDDRHSFKLYIEPHVEFDKRELTKFAAVDVVITPTTGQTLPAFELVHGPKSSLQLMEILQPRYIIPMPNADIDTSGMAAPFVNEVGKKTDFAQGLVNLQASGKLKHLPEIVSGAEPGKDVIVNL